MFGTHLLSRTILIGASAAALVAWSQPAQAAPRRASSCASAYSGAEELAKAGHLREAKDSMMKCAVARCLAVVRTECARRVSELEQDIPTVVPAVQDQSGQPLTDVQFVMDGELLASNLDGRAVAVDPGSHVFTFRNSLGILANVKTLILQGQHNRSIEVNLRDMREPPLVKTSAPLPSGGLAGARRPAGLEGTGRLGQASVIDNGAPARLMDVESNRGKRFTTASYSLAGLGLLGVTGYGLATYLGNRDVAACSPSCEESTLQNVRNVFLGGKIALGVGVASLAGATYLFLTSDNRRSSEVAVNRTSGYRVDVQPTESGGFAAVSGTF